MKFIFAFCVILAQCQFLDDIVHKELQTIDNIPQKSAGKVQLRKLQSCKDTEPDVCKGLVNEKRIGGECWSVAGMCMKCRKTCGLCRDYWGKWQKKYRNPKNFTGYNDCMSECTRDTLKKRCMSWCGWPKKYDECHA